MFKPIIFLFDIFYALTYKKNNKLKKNAMLCGGHNHIVVHCYFFIWTCMLPISICELENVLLSVNALSTEKKRRHDIVLSSMDS